MRAVRWPFADVLLPSDEGDQLWLAHGGSQIVHQRQDYHRDDAAIRPAWREKPGSRSKAIAVAHIDSGWIYPGQGDYQGLLRESDLSEEAFARADEVKGWVEQAQAVVQRASAPTLATGAQCFHPFECGFTTTAPAWSRRPSTPSTGCRAPARRYKNHVQAHGVAELRDLPDDLLNPLQMRVKHATLSGQAFFDQAGAAQALSAPAARVLHRL